MKITVYRPNQIGGCVTEIESRGGTRIIIDVSQYPAEFHELLAGAKIYDSSCSSRARVVFIDRDAGYFLKSAPD